MKLTISITGQIDEDNLKKVRPEIEKILSNCFKSFKFNWELVKGIEK